MVEIVNAISEDPVRWILALLEFIVLGYIILEISHLKRHQHVLSKSMEYLEKVRPFLSILYTEPEEIMDLAITSMQESKKLLALGSVGSLRETERKPDESDPDFSKRLSSVSQRTKDYVKATEDFILRGLGTTRYCRIMNFIPENDSDRAISEILSNVNFFLRQMEHANVRPLGLELYHNPTILKGRGDLHFRCSENKVILRVGGPENSRINEAIVNTDQRVVSAFEQYYQSIIDSKLTRKVDLHDLKELKLLLEKKELQGIRDYLAEMSKD